MNNYFRHYSSLSQEQARDLRQNPTGPERKLWFCFLKEQKPRFRRQKIIGPYIVDFFCAERNLAIELDGESHEESAQNDALRSQYLNELGIKVLRFTNQEITEQFEGVCQAIYNALVPPLQGAVSEADWGFDQVTALLQIQPPGTSCHPPEKGGQEVTPLIGGTRSLPMKTVTIYTDGACSGNPGPGGWGAILEFQGVEKELSGGEAMTTNNRMELTAVISALQALKEPCIVELYSDSKYVIDALEKGWAASWRKKGWIKSDKKPALNPDLWEKLLNLAQTHHLHYHWVKGHAENEKNNRCDQLAVAESRKYQL